MLFKEGCGFIAKDIDYESRRSFFSALLIGFPKKVIFSDAELLHEEHPPKIMTPDSIKNAEVR